MRFFRNRVPMLGLDTGCLWQLADGRLWLVDEDEDLNLAWEENQEYFYEVENPGNLSFF
jgi:hypothetical protein